MKNKIIIQFFFIVITSLVFTSCLKEKAGEINDEELITTMKLSFTPVSGSTPLVYFFDDPDGPGGVAPVIDTIRLSPGVSYNFSLELMNNSTLPPIDVTDEIKTEADAHRFYYETAGVTITVSDLDKDALGNPVGLTGKWSTGIAGSGATKITLRHYGATPPDKSPGDPVNSPKSSTDIEVSFPTKIQ